MSREAIESFAEEIRDALPNIRRALAVAHACPDDRAALLEAHRLTHSIKGTAAMVGVLSLSQIALHQETLLEQLLEGRLILDAGLRDTLERLNDVIESYADGLVTDTVPEQHLSDEALRLFHQQVLVNESANVLSDGTGRPIDLGQAPHNSELAEESLRPLTNHNPPILNSAIPDPSLEDQWAEFRDDALDHLHEMADKLDLFRRDLTRWEVLADVRRRVHSLKKSARMEGCLEFTLLAHHAEDLIQRLLDRTVPPTESAADCLQACVDALEEQLDNCLDESLLEMLHERLEFICGGRPTIATLPRVELEADGTATVEQEVEHSLLAAANDATENTTTELAEESQSSEFKPQFSSAESRTSTKSIDLGNRDNLLGEMLEVFTEEAEDHLRKIYAALSVLETHPAQMSQVQEVRRSAHTIKGAAGSVGMPLVSRLSHRMEDLLDSLFESQQQVTSSTLTLLYDTTDTLQDLVHGNFAPAEMQVTVARLYDNYDVVLAEAATPCSVVQASSLQLTPSDAVTDVAEPSDVITDVAEPSCNLEACTTNAIAPSEVAEVGIPSDVIAEVAMQTEVVAEVAEPSCKLEACTTKGVAPSDVAEVGIPSDVIEVGMPSDVVAEVAMQTEVMAEAAMLAGKEDLKSENLNLKSDISDFKSQMSHLKSESALNAQATALPQATVSLQEAVLPQESMSPQAVVSPQANDEVAFSLPRPLASSSSEALNSELSKPALKKPTESLRVPLDRIDSLVREVGELIINRTSFEQRMADFARCVEEIQRAVERLQNTSHELDAKFAVGALGGRLRMWGDGASLLPDVLRRTGAGHEEFDSLEMDRYSEFHLLSRSLAETTNDIGTVGQELRNLMSDFDHLLNRQGRLSRDTQDRLMRIRMVPLAMLATKLQRTVRVVSGQLGKSVDFLIHGGDIELDKMVLEELADPLMHILRNAVDHGIESAEQRLSRGKPEQATIRVQAIYQGTQIVIRVSDDGRGLNLDAIRQTAVRIGLVTPADAANLSDQELTEFIFLPGFSTARELSEVSGRGVGMDIVRDKVLQLKGSVSVDSQAGRGMTITIRLPMTLAVTRALLVHASNETFAVPMAAVAQILRLERNDIEQLGQSPMIRVTGEALPLLYLADRLKLRQPADKSSPQLPVLIVAAGDQKVALAVDKILSGRDIVVKTLGTHLRRAKGLIGATLMGDGSVVPILDTADLIGHSGTVTRSRRVLPPPAPPRHEQPVIMVVDDSVSVRRVMTNLLKKAGWTVLDAKDGVDALEQLHKTKRCPDLFLLDIEMPRMDGYELLSSLRSQGDYRETPIVMVTSRAGDKHRQRALQLGATDYVIKPYLDDQLLKLIRGLLAGEAMPATGVRSSNFLFGPAIEL